MKQLLSLFLALTTLVSFGQEIEKEKLYEAKKQLRNGNKAYETKNYADAAIAYQKSLAEDGTYYKGAYNLGNAYFNQKKYKEALEQFELANKLAETKGNKAKTSELIGDTFKKQKELEKALEAYKQALLKNPNDDILRQKFVAAKQAKQKQDQQQKDNKDDKNKDDKDKKDQDKKDDKDNKDSDKKKDGDKDKKDDKKDGDKDKKGDKDKDKDGENKDDKKDDKGEDKKDSEQKKGDKGEDKKEQQAQPQKSKLSPQQIQQLLESMSNEEQKTQKKVNAQKVKAKVNKNEKDW